jgi:hypothetical protein
MSFKLITADGKVIYISMCENSCNKCKEMKIRKKRPCKKKVAKRGNGTARTKNLVKKKEDTEHG